MKIDGTLNGQEVEKSAQSSARAKGQASGAATDPFAALLQSEVDSAGQTGSQDSAACTAASVAGLWGLQPIAPASGQSSQTSQAISSISGVLDGLDSLQNALKGASSPRQIDSLVQQVSQQASALADKASTLPADSGLSDLAEETKVTAYMESVKWKRGDYL